ncbi:glycosyltransferase family 4 protein [Flavobacterium pectinovorum]|uniref:glycosyltransferase family 4 protein n=1 Tax=Flavobacterium pectinovorum TaxID=29533 RepID=UPI001FACF56F|nr:glycosyltransferase family 4 protein [Flavobacterium pectinovorum]MCI9844941.1 glycosyltransferase family 4 protein [Flavobacterium pectinovorum]
MKLIQVTVSRGWRGHEQKIIYLYEAFKEYGYVEEQWIICPDDSETFKVATQKGMNVIALNNKSEYDLKYAKKFSKITKELNADLVFIHNSHSHTLMVLSKLLFGLTQPLVLCRTLIKRVDTNFFRKWKYDYNGIKKIICVSYPVVDILKPVIRDHSKLCVVGCVTDIHKFTKTQKTGILHKQYNIPSDYKIIGNIAAFVDFKDHVTWVNTVAELVKRGVKAKYILIGKGPLEMQVRKQISDLGLENEIIIAGFRKDIPEILPEFDLLLFTSNCEPLGGVILESYACKVPVVAGNAGGVPEVVTDNQTGLLAEVGNALSFADKVEKMLNDTELQENCIENGRKFLMENCTKEVVSKKMINELKGVLQKNNN